MVAPKTTRSIVRKKLCLKSTLKTCNYDPVAKVYFRNATAVPPPKETIVSPKVDDDLGDFKSPTKASITPKRTVTRRTRMPSKPYSYPIGIACTQDMFAAEWNRAGAGQTEYLSENEFEDFKDERKREALLRSKAQYRNSSLSAKTEENSINQIAKLNIRSEVKPTEPTIPRMNSCSEESGGVITSIVSSSEEVTNADDAVTSSPMLLHTHFSSPNGIATSENKKKSTDYLRSELRNIKIEKVTIADSDLSEDEVVCSQIPNSRKLKNSAKIFFNQNGELKSSQDLKADEKILGATASASIQTTSSSMPLKVSPSDQVEVKKTNCKTVHVVALPSVDKLTKKEAQCKSEPTPNFLDAKINSMHMCPSIKLPLQLSIVRFTESEWRVETLSTALKPSRTNFKTFNQTFNHFKKYRFSRIRSLRWKVKILKRKPIFHLIYFFSGM